MTNTERQRQFRERNPGYYGRLHAKRKAALEAGIAPGTAPQPARASLMLPAPVETIEIPGLTTLPTPAQWQAAREAFAAAERAAA